MHVRSYAQIPPFTTLDGGAEPLRIICACAPAYSDEDTELLE
jgi:hypothetical protein